MPAFFRALAKNNDRDWFAARKDVFEKEVKRPMIELVGRINDGLRKVAAEHVVEPPAKALYRIYRDTRFSKDKTPYKTHQAANFPRRGLPKNGAAGYYFAVSHEGVQVGGGIYMPGPDELRAVRAAIARDAKGFLKLISDKRLKKVMGSVQGEKLTRIPKGFESHADSPAAEWIRHKQLYWFITLPPALALSGKLLSELIMRFKLMSDGIEWLNQAVLSARKSGEGEEEGVVKRPAPMW